MRAFSLVIPCESNRLDLLAKTVRRYRELGLDRYPYEFVVPTRSLPSPGPLDGLGIRHRLVRYDYQGESFNPAMALNLGVGHARHDTLIVQSPEVIAETDVLAQFSALPPGNYVAQVWDLGPTGRRERRLAVPDFIHDTAGAYFLAQFRRADLLAINGWDEDFMGGYCFEDNDFGRRWHTAGLPIELREEIVAEHQWHPRTAGTTPGWKRNCRLYHRKKARGRSWCDNGLEKVKSREPDSPTLDS
ncbi:MAG: hypothetical protein GXY83_14405 [Rhodopirellula sp.]|nr:hypothetical protein [Rhodopirellula sp.]